MRVGVLLIAVVLLAVGCQDFDPENRRAARIDEYEIRDQTCEVGANEAADQAAAVIVARGTLINRADETQGFSVTVRFLDGEVDAGRPRTLDHTELIEPGATWAWTISSDQLDEVPSDPRCNVIQVAIGDDVDL